MFGRKNPTADWKRRDPLGVPFDFDVPSLGGVSLSSGSIRSSALGRRSVGRVPTNRSPPSPTAKNLLLTNLQPSTHGELDPCVWKLVRASVLCEQHAEQRSWQGAEGAGLSQPPF
jgi:hypothetical protein